MRRAPSVLCAFLLTVVGLLVLAPAGSASAATTTGRIQLLSATLGPAKGRVVLSYRVSCPVGPTTAFVSGVVTQRTLTGVVQSQNYREITCTGRSRMLDISVPSSPTGSFDDGRALIESEVSADNEPGSWQGTDVSTVGFKAGFTRLPRTLVNDQLGAAMPVDAPYLDASVRLDSARVVARGAGVELTYEAKCPKDYFSYLFTATTQGDLRADGVLEFYCTGAPQTLVTVASLDEGAPFDRGTADVTAFLNNCPEDVGCFRANDADSVELAPLPNCPPSITRGPARSRTGQVLLRGACPETRR